MKVFATKEQVAAVPVSSGFEPIPVGDHQLVLQTYTDKESSTGGAYLEVRIEVIAGISENRVFFVKYNYDNSNPKAVEMALRDMKALLHACGQDGEELTTAGFDDAIGVPFMGRLTIREGNNGFPASNNISNYYSIDAYNAKVADGSLKQKLPMKAATAPAAPKAPAAASAPKAPAAPRAPAKAPAAQAKAAAPAMAPTGSVPPAPGGAPKPVHINADELPEWSKD